jgi:ribokinase
LTILVLGNATVDLSYKVERLPVPGETLLARSKLVDAGGKGLNQAVVAHRAGAAVRFCASVGEDDAAEVILRHVAAEGLSAACLWRHAGPTDESLIFVASSGENAIVSTADAARSLPPTAARAALEGLTEGDTLLMQGNLGRPTTLAGLEAARAAGLGTLLNPAPIAFDYAGLWPLIDVAILNEVEAKLLGGSEHVDSAAVRLLAAGSRWVVVTLGAAGARLYDASGMTPVPAPAVTPVDTTGAGDVVCGVLTAGLSQGMAMRAAIGWAVAAASLSVTRRGTGAAFPTRAELAELRVAALATAEAA